MKKLLLLASLCTTFLLSGCNSISKPASTPLADLLTQNPEKGAIAVLYDTSIVLDGLLLRGGFVAVACTNEAKKDFRFLSPLWPDQSHVTMVEPGRYAVIPSGETLTYATVEVEAGKFYALNISPHTGWLTHRVSLDKVVIDEKFIKKFKSFERFDATKYGYERCIEYLTPKVFRLHKHGIRLENTLEASDGMPFNEFLSIYNSTH